MALQIKRFPVSKSAGPAVNPAPWLVVCDFDGTIADCDVTDGILTRFALPEWEAVEAEWKAGLIGSRECMARQVELVRATRDQLDGYLDTVKIDPAFAAFVEDCEALELPLLVVSDGIDYAIGHVLARHGLGHLPRVSNHLVRTGDDSYRLEFPYAAPHCRAGSGTCKCSISATRAGQARRLLIGDGTSDFCLAGEADLVFAKSKLLKRCHERELPHRDCPDFTTARALLPLLEGVGERPVRVVAAPPARAARGTRSKVPNLMEVALNG